MTIRTLARARCYRDSVVLLGLARALRALDGVRAAAALMGTPANHDLLDRSGLLTPEARQAGPNDLVVVVRAETPEAASRALDAAEARLAAQPRASGGPARARPRTLERAVARWPQANLALVSVPGAFAAAEARKALALGLHVMLFSDNVSLADEIDLKRRAAARGRLLMGPDCGTAYVGGVPLGFANAVPRGRVGVVAASGTGLQQVATLLAAQGEGLSQGIGVGGRDMSEEVGGIMTLLALDALADDPDTALVLVVGKPPAPSVRARVEARLATLGKPAVLALLGPDVATRAAGPVWTVGTLADAGAAAVARLRGRAFAPRPFTAPAAEIARRAREARNALGPGQTGVCGLYAGGTLAHEARLVLEAILGPVGGNLAPAGSPTPHRVVDLGADEYTVGRPHPMLDAAARVEAIADAARDPAVGVLLLDVVLGHGAAVDPAGDLVPAIEAARATAGADGRGLAVVATVVGTAGDPQEHAAQVARLERAGAWVLPSNAEAARACAGIAGGERVLSALLAGAA